MCDPRGSGVVRCHNGSTSNRRPATPLATHRARRPCSTALLAAAVAAACPALTRAADITWSAPTSGSFQSPTSWLPAAVPGATDNAIFNANAPLASPYTVTLAAPTTTAALWFGNDNLTLDLGGNTLTVNGPTNAVSLGFNGGTSTVTLAHGTLAAQGTSGLLVGEAIRSNAKLTVDNATLAIDGQIFVARSASSRGELVLANGATAVSHGSVSVGHAQNSYGTLRVTGPGTRLDLTAANGGAKPVLRVANGNSGATGLLEVTAGGVVTAEGGLNIGLFNSASGTVRVSGAGSGLALVGGSILLQGAATTLTVDGGATVSTRGTLFTDTTSAARFSVTVDGVNGTARSTLLVNGTNGTWAFGGTTGYVRTSTESTLGGSGNTVATISNGALTVFAKDLILSPYDGVQGSSTLTVAGASGTWQAELLINGNLGIATAAYSTSVASVARIIVGAGGAARVAGQTVLEQSSGTAAVTIVGGGSLSTGIFHGSGGALNILNGTLHIGDGIDYPPSTSGATRSDIDNNLYLSADAPDHVAALSIESPKVTADNVYVGTTIDKTFGGPLSNAVNPALLSITAGASLTMADLRIYRTGTVRVYAGGTLTASTLAVISDATNRTDPAITFDGATLNVAGSLHAGKGYVLGTAPVIGPGTLLTVGNNVFLDPGGTATLAGGTIRASTIAYNGGAFNFLSGTLIKSGTNLAVAPGGFLGNDVTLAAGQTLQTTATNATTIAPGASLTLAGGTFVTSATTNNGSIQHNAGSMTLGPLSGTGTVNFSPASSGLLTVTSLQQAALTLDGNATLRLATNPTRLASTIGALSLAGSGTLDLGNGILQLDNAKTSTSSVVAALKQAYNFNAQTKFGRWDGPGGLTSSDAVASVTAGTGQVTVAYVDGAIQNKYPGLDLHNTLGGPTLATNRTLVRAALMGDVNLDGRVNGDDISVIAQFGRYNKTAPDGWVNGDLNYDGVVNGDDISLIAQTRTYNAATVYGDAAAASPALAAASADLAAASTVGVSGDKVFDYVYDRGTGELRIQYDGDTNITADTPLATLKVLSAAGRINVTVANQNRPAGVTRPFTTTASEITWTFFEPADGTFPDGYSFGNIFPAGLTAAQVLSDLDLSYARSGALGYTTADLVVVPEPTATLALTTLASLTALARPRRRRRRHGQLR